MWDYFAEAASEIFFGTSMEEFLRPRPRLAHPLWDSRLVGQLGEDDVIYDATRWEG